MPRNHQPLISPHSSATQPALTFTRHWHHLSATSRTLGPLSVQIATLLMGKHKPRGIYSPANDQAGDYVVITDAEKVVVTGKKAEQKVYYRHSMYPGGLKVETYGERMSKKPEEVSGRAREEEKAIELDVC